MVQIVIIGSGNPVGDDVQKITREVGTEIAKEKAILVCGGMGGVMDDSCYGAKKAGGITVGILPHDEKSASKHLTVKIPTMLGEGRNPLVVNSGDAIILIRGGEGTEGEFYDALEKGKPIVILDNTGGVADKIAQQIEDGKENYGDQVKVAKTAEEAVQLAIKMAKNYRKQKKL